MGGGKIFRLRQNRAGGNRMGLVLQLAWRRVSQDGVRFSETHVIFPFFKPFIHEIGFGKIIRLPNGSAGGDRTGLAATEWVLFFNWLGVEFHRTEYDYLNWRMLSRLIFGEFVVIVGPVYSYIRRRLVDLMLARPAREVSEFSSQYKSDTRKMISMLAQDREKALNCSKQHL